MEGKKVQGAMRHEDQMLGFELLSDGSNEFQVKRFEVTLRRGEERLLKSVCIGSAHPKFRKLKPQQVEKVDDPREHADSGDLDRSARDHRGNESIAGRIVFDHRRIQRKMGLQRGEEEGSG